MNATPHSDHRSEKVRMLGLVTLYNPDRNVAVGNIKHYIGDIDALMIWDNSKREAGLQEWMMPALEDDSSKVIWRGDGENHFIAAAINDAWRYAENQGYDLLLMMDQDSRWEDFTAYKEQVERCYLDNPRQLFCPYVPANNPFEITSDIQIVHEFINSGAVIPVSILHAIGGADERFPLDALDYDMGHRIQNAGYSIVCLTRHHLHHQLGRSRRMGPFNIYTSDYGPERTYSISKSFILYYRKHRKTLSSSEKRFVIKEHYIKKLYRIILAEPQKFSRIKQFIIGIYDGLTYRFEHDAK